MINWVLVGILFAVALACCAMGFKRFVWFMSVGYGFAVAGIALASLGHSIGNKCFRVGLCVALVVAAAYGLRLGGFLLKRELGNKTYKKILDDKMGKEPPVFVKVFMWLAMGAIYICETAGLHFRLDNATGTVPADDWAVWVGAAVMAAGAVIEALSDHQKSAQKAKNPNMVACEGLFRMVRCPNYFGEILFWTGVFLSGVTVYANWAQWVIAVIGYVCIVFIMLDGAKRMEKGHLQRYGAKKEYQEYAAKTPLIFPLIPLYHLYDPAKDKKEK